VNSINGTTFYKKSAKPTISPRVRQGVFDLPAAKTRQTPRSRVCPSSGNQLTSSEGHAISRWATSVGAIPTTRNCLFLSIPDVNQRLLRDGTALRYVRNTHGRSWYDDNFYFNHIPDDDLLERQRLVRGSINQIATLRHSHRPTVRRPWENTPAPPNTASRAASLHSKGIRPLARQTGDRSATHDWRSNGKHRWRVLLRKLLLSPIMSGDLEKERLPAGAGDLAGSAPFSDDLGHRRSKKSATCGEDVDGVLENSRLGRGLWRRRDSQRRFADTGEFFI